MRHTGSLFANDSEIGTWTADFGLMMVDEFPDVFPHDLLDLPPNREIEFSIYLVPSAQSVSIAPYRMTPVELIELWRQLNELLEKDFIKSSYSTWGVPIIF